MRSPRLFLPKISYIRKLDLISKKYIVNPFSYNIQVISNEVLDEVSLRIIKTRIFSLQTKSSKLQQNLIPN